MNQAILMGRLVRDPNKSSTQSGMTVTKFTVAVDRIPDKDGTTKADFISCIAFGKTGDNVAKFFWKGKPIGIYGRIQTGSYENKEGKTVYTTDVICDRFEFVPADNSSRKREDPEYPDQRKVKAELDGMQAAFEALDEEVPF